MAYNKLTGPIGLLLLAISMNLFEHCQAKLRATNALLELEGAQPRSPDRIKRGTDREQLANLDGIAVQQIELISDAIWTTKISLGGQQFTVIVDTGSSDLWLPSVRCTSPECLRRHRYDPAQSGSYSRGKDDRDIQIQYGGNVQVYGREASDTLELGGIKIESQSFLMVYMITGPGMTHLAEVDGIIGLAYRSLSRLGAMTPFEQMLNQELLNQPVFSMAPASGESNKGELTFGSAGQGYQASEFKNASLFQARYWEFALAGVSLEREEPNSLQSSVLFEVCTGHVRCNAIADSGASLIMGSPREVREINGQLGASEWRNGIFRFASCEVIESLPNLVFTIDHGDKLVFTPKMYTIQRGDVCLSGLAMQPASSFPFWILGKTFLDNFNTLYDYQNRRVGFAPLH